MLNTLSSQTGCKYRAQLAMMERGAGRITCLLPTGAGEQVLFRALPSRAICGVSHVSFLPVQLYDGSFFGNLSGKESRQASIYIYGHGNLLSKTVTRIC